MSQLKGQHVMAGSGFGDGQDELVELARTMKADRARICGFFPASLFGEPARDILLELYIAHGEGRLVAVTSCATAVGVPFSTALRWIARMEQDGFLNRKDDQHDLRRSYLMLSDKAYAGMQAYLAACVGSPP